MQKTTPGEAVVLGIAISCLALGLVVGPLVSTVAASTWVPITIGVLLIVQWVSMRRARARAR